VLKCGDNAIKKLGRGMGQGRKWEFHRPLDRGPYISSVVRNNGSTSRSQFFVITNCLVGGPACDVLWYHGGCELARKLFYE
jgi:hypothetical protein